MKSLPTSRRLGLFRTGTDRTKRFSCRRADVWKYGTGNVIELWQVSGFVFVSDPLDGDDVTSADLLAQLADVDVDRAVSDHDFAAPDP